MRHGKKRHDRHEHTDDPGALIHRARSYEIGAAINFLGRRRRVYDDLVALSGARGGDRVLDVGCGTGYFTRRAVRAVTPGGQAVGVDASPPVIEYAAGSAPANCTFHVANAQDLPYADASFDVVISSLTIHHLPPDDRLTALREMRRVLRPPGRLLIVDFRQQPRHLRLARLIGALSKHASQHHPTGEMAGLVRQAGFNVIGTGDRWPSLHYVQGELPGIDAPEQVARFGPEV